MIKKASFTLIEMLIAISIISLLVPSLITLLFNNIRAYNRAIVVSQVKRTGDNIFDILNSRLRNQVWAIYSNEQATSEVCTTRSGDTTASTAVHPLYFRRENGEIFYFSQNGTILQLVDNLLTTPLTSDKVIVSNFSLSCTRQSAYNPPIIDVAFVVTQGSGQVLSEQQESMSYQTKIKMRQY